MEFNEPSHEFFLATFTGSEKLNTNHCTQN